MEAERCRRMIVKQRGRWPQGLRKPRRLYQSNGRKINELASKLKAFANVVSENTERLQISQATVESMGVALDRLEGGK